MENPMFKSNGDFYPSNNATVLIENDNKSFCHSPIQLDGYGTKDSPKSRFTSIRKMFEPLTKSHSRRNSISFKLDRQDTISSDQIVSGQSMTLQKSPSQLHGDLRLEHKHGVPYFELRLAHSEQVFVAKTWKAEEDSHNWVYTFHSLQGKKKSNGNKGSQIIGQMQVSSHLLSKLQECGTCSNSMVTEFVLHDLTQRRKSFPPEEFDSVYCSPYPWAPADLNPSLEVAALVIQAPLKESLKCSSGDTFDLHLPQKTHAERRVDVVTPTGNHGLPDCESGGTSSLLDRWRLGGGGCDCGGWDMACPLAVFSNSSTEIKEDLPFLQQDRPFELCVQGAKEETPALSINFHGKGKYGVDFQAKLSILQAFGICVAMLHATDASTRANREENKQCSTLKDLFEDELKSLIESVTEKMVKENHPSSFILNPPFSPISRV